MKKLINHRNIAILLLFVIFLFSNLIIPAGIAGGNYYEYASGGYTQAAQNDYQMVFNYNAIEPETFYNGSMNWVLRPLSKLFPSLDIRVMGLILFFLVLCFFAVLIYKMKFTKKWHAILFEFFTIFVFGDFAYLLHFNTMTTQGLLLCAMLLMTCILMYQYHVSVAIWRNVVYCLLCVFVSGLSEGWYLLGILLSLLIIPTFFMRRSTKYLVTTTAVCFLGIIGICFMFSGGVGDKLHNTALTNSTFYGIYKDNTKDMSHEIMPEKLIKKYSGKSAFEIKEDIQVDYSYTDVFTYYLKNPTLLQNKLKIVAGNAFEIRARYIANYPDGKLKNGFTLYSTLKRRFMQPDAWFVLAVALGMILFCAFSIKKEKKKHIRCHYVYLIMLSLISLYAFLAPLIINGEAQLQENLFCYNIIFDTMLINAVVGGAIVASHRRDALKEKYGVNQ